MTDNKCQCKESHKRAESEFWGRVIDSGYFKNHNIIRLVQEGKAERLENGFVRVPTPEGAPVLEITCQQPCGTA